MINRTKANKVHGVQFIIIEMMGGKFNNVHKVNT